jgi:hypothetical protein
LTGSCAVAACGGLTGSGATPRAALFRGGRAGTGCRTPRLEAAFGGLTGLASRAVRFCRSFFEAPAPRASRVLRAGVRGTDLPFVFFVLAAIAYSESGS